MAERLTSFAITVAPGGGKFSVTKCALARNREEALMLVHKYPRDRVTIGPAPAFADLQLRFEHLLPASPKDLRNFYQELKTAMRGSSSVGAALVTALPALTGPRVVLACLRAARAHDESRGNVATLGELRSFLPVEHVERLTAAAETGDVAAVIDELARYSDKSMRRVSRLMQALAEPVITLTGIIAGGLFIALVQLPFLTSLLKANHTDLPSSTRLMIQAAEVIRAYPIVGGLIALSPVAVAIWFRSLYANFQWLQELIDHLPVINGIAAKWRWHRQLRQLSMLIASSGPLAPKLAKVGRSTTHLRTRRFWQAVEAEVSVKYDSLHEVCRKQQYLLGNIDTRWIELMPAALKAGELHEALRTVADDYEERTDGALDMLPSVAKFVVMTVSAVVLLVVALGTIMPTFTLLTHLK